MFSQIRKLREARIEAKRVQDYVTRAYLDVAKMSIPQVKEQVLPLLSGSNYFVCVEAPMKSETTSSFLNQSIRDLFRQYETIQSGGQLHLSRTLVQRIAWRPEFVQIGFQGSEAVCILPDEEPIYLDPDEVNTVDSTFKSVFHMLFLEYLTDPRVVDSAI